MKTTVVAFFGESNSICYSSSHYLGSSLNGSPAIGFTNEFDLFSRIATKRGKSPETVTFSVLRHCKDLENKGILRKK
jgi:hypothetical protein